MVFHSNLYKFSIIKPAHLTGHVTIDPTTKQLVYTPWNLSESEVLSSVDAMDPKMIKREVIEISDDEREMQTIELGRIVNYDQLREIFVDRSPLHSDTETDSEPEQTGLESDTMHGDDEPLLTGTTAHTSLSVTTSCTDQVQEVLKESDHGGKTSVNTGKAELQGTTNTISQQELIELRQELAISEDEPDNVLNLSSGSDKMLKGATGAINRTLEDAIWKESASEFLIVDDNILNMPDCTLSIKSLNDREIEIKLDPKPKQTAPPKTIETESEPADQISTPVDTVEKEIQDAEPVDKDSVPTQKPKIKIGTGKPKNDRELKLKAVARVTPQGTL